MGFFIMETEIWKDVKDYEGFYQISSYGNIRSLNKRVIINNKECIIDRIKLLKKRKCKQGYEIITITYNKKVKCFKIHRLVAQAFLENINNKRCVNHKDFNKSNNNIINLEWVTNKENTKHFYEFGNPYNRNGKNNGRSKKIIDTSTKIIYDTIQEASKLYNYSQPYLSMMLSGKMKNNTSLVLCQDV